MSRLAAPLVLFLLVSCAPTTFYTDDVFRNSAPEVVRAWDSLSPLRQARRQDLADGSLKALQEALGPRGPAYAVVGFALSPSERRELQAAYPGSQFLFAVAGPPVPGENVITVRRAEAWAAVARRAAAPVAAAAVFPADALPGEIQEFQAAWTEAGGGPMVTSVQFQPGLLDGKPLQFFQWTVGEPDGRVAARPEITLNGNPGMVRQPGTTGLTWRIREQGLADLLWNAAHDKEKIAHFLPLETVLDSR